MLKNYSDSPINAEYRCKYYRITGIADEFIQKDYEGTLM